MKKYFLAGFLLLTISVYSQSSLVTTKNGRIEGTQSGSGIRLFKGIPFAKPPVGPLRWKAPQPVANWKGIKKCTAFSASPMQASPMPFMFWSTEFLIPREPISEDCLYLNVWTGAKNGLEKRPVIVYIYGGGFRSGGSACPIYDGEAMAKKGVVFVSINYRVGVFGFFAHPQLSAETSYKSSGNYALLDMIAALKWVQQNIAAFGGDPRNVTIAGQSAGAFAVNYLTATPLAKGLFQKAIAESGGSFLSGQLRPDTDLAAAEQQGISFAKALNCTSLEELRNKPASEIQKNQSGLSWPIVDGYVVPESIFDIYKEGKQNDVTTIAGWNHDDRLFPQPMKADAYKEQATKRFGSLSDEFLSLYPGSTDEEAARSQTDQSRDESFAIQDYTWAKMQTQTGKSAIYVYNFNRSLPAYTPETAFGAFHSAEIVYAYNNLHTLDRPWQKTDYAIADAMSSYWANFAKTGNPNGTGLPQWEPYNPVSEKVLLIDSVIKSSPLPDRNKLLFWEKFMTAPGSAGSRSATDEGEVVTRIIHSTLLKNSGGENPDRRISVYLPPGYNSSGIRYPVIYYLHGFMGTDSIYPAMKKILDLGIAEKKIRPFILVIPDQYTLYEGSFYSNSDLTGNWSGFTAKELVSYMDQQFRTIANRDSRGLCGHSMGGYGAIKIGMLFPDVFSSVYAMSPGLLAFVKEFGPNSTSFKEVQQIKTHEELKKTYYPRVLVAVARAWSPNPANPPFFCDFPFTYTGDNMIINEQVLRKWQENMPVYMVDKYADNLRKLKALKLDWGRNDAPRFPLQCSMFSQRLENLGINHYAEEYIGDHGNKIWTTDGRVLNELLPFFNDYLIF